MRVNETRMRPLKSSRVLGAIKPGRGGRHDLAEEGGDGSELHSIDRQGKKEFTRRVPPALSLQDRGCQC